MHSSSRRGVCGVVFLLASLASVSTLFAQSDSGIVSGTVTDPVGAALPGAVVTILNPVSEYSRSVVTDSAGHFQFTNLPLNSYHMTASANGFAAPAQDAHVTSSIPQTITIALNNHRPTEFFGMGLEQIYNGGWIEALHPDEKDDVLAGIDENFRKGEPYQMEYRRRCSTGEYRWVALPTLSRSPCDPHQRKRS